MLAWACRGSPIQHKHSLRVNPEMTVACFWPDAPPAFVMNKNNQYKHRNMRNHFGTIIQCPCLFPSFPLDHYCMDYYRFELIFIEVLTSAFWLKPSVKWIEWTEWTVEDSGDESHRPHQSAQSAGREAPMAGRPEDPGGIQSARR